MPFRTSTEIDNMSDMQKERATSPVQVFNYVRAVDIGTDYVSGSEGLLKTLIEYEDYAKTTPISTTVFKYQYVDLPTKVSEIVVI